jgi:hypothetical protein
LLVISPAFEVPIADPTDRYGFLRPMRPVDVIGHALDVYDLDSVEK